MCQKTERFEQSFVDKVRRKILRFIYVFSDTVLCMLKRQLQNYQSINHLLTLLENTFRDMKLKTLEIRAVIRETCIPIY